MNERLQALVNSGRVKAIGGSGEMETILETVAGCDEAIIHLRRAGRDVGVLVYATGEGEGAQHRAADLVERL